MSIPAKIKYYKRTDIDSEKWDACIRNASNGLIYSYSFYLDALCDQWDALIMNDYEAVMPLPWRKKWGIRYVYQPPFIQRLGVFGNLDPDLINIFYKQACKHFQFLHYNVSEQINISKIKMKRRQNFTVNLNEEYNEIKSAYTKECLLNIKKAKERGCHFSENVCPDELIKNYRLAYGSKNSVLKDKDYSSFLKLLKESEERNAVELLGVKNSEGSIIYTAAIFNDEKRLYYVLGAPNDQGRQKRATYFFIDYLLQSNCGQPRFFDFEGSDIPNVAAFYQKFGPQKEYYYELKAIPVLDFF
jgi:hypothetical protein